MKTKENGAVMKNGMWIFLLMMVFGGSKQYSFAQSDIGGGGDIYECVENGKTSYYLLDVLLAKKLNMSVDLKIPEGVVYQKNDQGQAVMLKLAIMQARLSRFDPVRAAQFATEANAIWEDIQALRRGDRAPNQLVYLSEDPLKFKDDSGLQFRFENCKADRLVTQRPPLGPRNDWYYKINRKALDLLDTDNVVATLWHEAIYRVFREQAQHKTSELAQYLNRELFTGSFENWKSCEYGKWIIDNAQMSNWMAWGRWKVRLSENMQCSPVNEIEKLNVSEKITSGEFKIGISDLELDKSGNLLRAKNLSGFELNADRTRVVRIHDRCELGRGEVEVIPGALRFTGLGKDCYPSGAYQADLDLYPDGTVKINTGLFPRKAPIQGRVLEKSMQILECATGLEDRVRKSQRRKLSKSHEGKTIRMETLRTLFEKTRAILVTSNTTNDDQIIAQLEDVHSQCRTNSITVMPRSNVDMENLAWAFVKQDAHACYRFGVNARAGALISASAAFWLIRCDFVNGKSRWYAGPSLGIGVGAAASVNIEYGGPDGVSIDSMKSGYGESSDDLDYNVTRGLFSSAQPSLEYAEVITPFWNGDTAGTDNHLRQGFGGGAFLIHVAGTLAPNLYTERRLTMDWAMQLLQRDLTQRIP